MQAACDRFMAHNALFKMSLSPRLVRGLIFLQKYLSAELKKFVMAQQQRGERYLYRRGTTEIRRGGYNKKAAIKKPKAASFGGLRLWCGEQNYFLIGM